MLPLSQEAVINKVMAAMPIVFNNLKLFIFIIIFNCDADMGADELMDSCRLSPLQMAQIFQSLY